jgi:hypothetical protein
MRWEKMSRKIKFRCWDKDLKRMIYGILNLRNILCFKNVEVMQFIGLKDINEKEIYEGDIVKFKLGRRFYKYIIAWDNLNACFFGLQVPCKIYTGGNKEKEFFRKIEVIGNIYENSELNKLNQKMRWEKMSKISRIERRYKEKW